MTSKTVWCLPPSFAVRMIPFHIVQLNQFQQLKQLLSMQLVGRHLSGPNPRVFTGHLCQVLHANYSTTSIRE